MSFAPRRGQWQRGVAWLLIVLGLVYMMFGGGGGWSGLYAVELRIISTLTLATALGIWLLVALRNPFWRPQSFLWPSVAAALVVLVIAASTAWHLRIAVDFVAYAVLLAAAYLFLQRLFCHQFFDHRLASFAMLLGFGIGVWYLTQVIVHWLHFWMDLGRFVTPPLRPNFEGLTFGNPSAVATLMILCWLASAAHVGLATTRRRSAIAALGIVSILVVLITGSRGAWAGLAITAGVCGPLWLMTGDRRRTIRQLLGSHRVRVGLAGISAGTVVVAVLLLPAIGSRLAEPASETRSAFYASALRMFADDPLTGQGPGSWVVRRITFTDPTETDYYIPHAHNLFLQTVAELGVLGVLGAVALAANFLLLVRRGLRSERSMTRRTAVAAVVAAIYLGGHQLFDFYPNMVGSIFPFALVVSRLDALVVSEHPARRVPGRAIVVAFAIALVLSTGWLLRVERAAVPGHEAVELANEGDWARALPLAEKAAAADNAMPPYLFPLGLARAHAGNLDGAVQALRASAAIDDYPLAWLNVAWLELERGNRAAAHDAREAAMRLGHQQPQVAVGAAAVDLRLGNEQAASESVASAFAVAPSLVSDPYWRSRPELRELWPRAVERALDTAPPSSGYLVALEARRLDRLAEQLSRVPAGDRATAGAVARAWTGDHASFEMIRAVSLKDPLRYHVVARCRRVAQIARTEGRGDGWTCDGAGRSPTYLIVRVVDQVASRSYLPGPNAAWHFQYVYRRSDPWDALVPGLPRLEASIP